MGYLGTVWVALGVLLISKIWNLFNVLVWRPYAIRKWFAKQGISGPPYSFISGSLHEMKTLRMQASNTVLDTHSHDIIPRILPHHHKWASQYGEVFLYWQGTEPRLFMVEPEIAKDLFSNKTGFYVKQKMSPSIMALFGKGLVLSDGSDWQRHRKVVSPAFNLDKLKGMAKRMAVCTQSMVDGWKDQVLQANGQSKEIQINREFQALAADIIASTAFSASYSVGKEIFEAEKELFQRAAMIDFVIPGSQYLPTRWNLDTWKLEKKLRNRLKSIIEERLNSKDRNGSDSGYGDDLLGIMLGISESSKKHEDLKLSMDEIMDECKTFFFAGHETTANLLTWTMYLLSLYKEWQEKLREEVMKECGMEIPDADNLNKLKLVNLFLLEVLRLYCPVIELYRTTTKDTKLGDLMIPKNTTVAIPMVMIHRNKKYWGKDADEFNPMRFADGVARAATHPNAFLAFSTGPRACIGQNFTMLEAKTAVAMILQRFSLSLSPEYKHAPMNELTLQPQFGLPIILSMAR
ncbi:cytochrome P450 709B2-like [Magnolia sinica]|uniref:cytochrome P450 709B2-like n=1 Tax=Magnolia sinica TaxID=86752 RepID=UPI00265AFAC2|nr:cytochrome P450 709B2-like [Magnolia sinica]